MNYISRFEELLAAEARRQGADGVDLRPYPPCDHARPVSGVAYVNTGDWVESCTAMVEHYDGAFELIRWAEVDGRRTARARTLVDAAIGERAA